MTPDRIDKAMDMIERGFDLFIDWIAIPFAIISGSAMVISQVYIYFTR